MLYSTVSSRQLSTERTTFLPPTVDSQERLIRILSLSTPAILVKNPGVFFVHFPFLNFLLYLIHEQTNKYS